MTPMIYTRIRAQDRRVGFCVPLSFISFHSSIISPFDRAVECKFSLEWAEHPAIHSHFARELERPRDGAVEREKEPQPLPYRVEIDFY